MVIASWNVNSIRARVDHVRKWIEDCRPDVLLLQELKASEFPEMLFKTLGYESAAVTQKSYNGVAVLSRAPLEVVSTTLIIMQLAWLEDDPRGFAASSCFWQRRDHIACL